MKHDWQDCSEWAQSSYQCQRCGVFSGWVSKAELDDYFTDCAGLPRERPKGVQNEASDACPKATRP